jgi:hypothetical protein
VLLYITLQLRSMLGISRTASSALFANLCKRLNHFDMRSLANAHLTSGIRGNAQNRRMYRQCMQIQPTTSSTIAVRTPHYQSECVDFLKRWDSGWLRWFHESRKAQTTM